MERAFDHPSAALHDVTFCVIDLETTGASPEHDAITEVGAVKVRGGECLGTFHTLVDPGGPVPPRVTMLTGITTAMVQAAPRMAQILPTLAEFAGGAVLVGHNVRFDLSFLRVAFERAGWPPPAHPTVDTCALARRLMRDEVPDCRLGTLADRLRLDHRPCHRALDDALATTDLLHRLLERAASWGVLALDDLLALPRAARHPESAKLALTAGLPRAPGIYVFRDRGGRALYVGKASDLRARVRSYFSSDERRKVGQLLREAAAVDHHVCGSPLEAAVLEVRLIHRLRPRFNRQVKAWDRYAYLKLTLGEAFPRLAVVREARADDALYLGPLPSRAAARSAQEAIETAVPLRRCTSRPTGRRPLREATCTPAQLGVATCPCAGAVSKQDYDLLVDQVRSGLEAQPALLVDPLRARLARLAEAERFEEAADVHRRLRSLTEALSRQRRLDALRAAGRMELELPDGRRLVLRAGLLDVDWEPSALGVPAHRPRDAPGAGAPLPRHLVDEVACIAGWLQRGAAGARLVDVEGPWASPVR